ncbi:MAG: hypothetical protein NDI82_10980 [Anaeromyxobacteraceae bacterium]|nr:hypothetical protein [Anaeromyxobacteraceae bacterium]
MPEPSDCGDPTCERCHPPRGRCEACGALHADPEVPFCSLDCAVADGGQEAGAADAADR